jgi:cardiolipin synthase C
VTFYLKLLLISLLISLSACASITPQKRLQAQKIAKQAQETQIECQQLDACALPSAIRDLGDKAFIESTVEQPKHAVILLDRGQDSLLARLHLIHSAKESIELQTFIFDQDDSGLLTLQALMQAAKRGVKVRILLDQLYGLSEPICRRHWRAITKILNCVYTILCLMKQKRKN